MVLHFTVNHYIIVDECIGGKQGPSEGDCWAIEGVTMLITCQKCGTTMDVQVRHKDAKKGLVCPSCKHWFVVTKGMSRQLSREHRRVEEAIDAGKCPTCLNEFPANANYCGKCGTLLKGYRGQG